MAYLLKNNNKNIIKNIIVIAVTCILLLSSFPIIASAEGIAWEDKIPLDTPWFKPVIDGQRDEGYSEVYTVRNRLQNHVIHEGGSRLSTAWFGNTLFFHIWVPDSTASETTSCLFYQADNVWFLLYFGEEANNAVKWSQNEMAKTFRILPFANVINFKGQCNDQGAFPPKSRDFEWKILIEENVGYSIEVAYTVPQEIVTLESGYECAFDVEVVDVCEGTTQSLDYRYVMGEAWSENDIENFPYAYGAKIVLSGGENAHVTQPPVTEPSATDPAFPNTQATTEADAENGKSGGTFVVPGIVACAACIALIIAAILTKGKHLRIVFIALALVCAILAAVFLVAAGSQTAGTSESDTETESAPVTEEEPRVVRHEYFENRFFRDGITYTSNKIAGAILGSFSYAYGSAAWEFGQYGSKYDIVKDGTYTEIAEGVFQYEDKGKLLYIDTNTGMFKMGLFGSQEYDEPRKNGQVAPGMLLTTNEMADTIMISELASIEVTFDFTIDYVTNCMKKYEYEDWLHTAMWNYYAFVKDVKSNEWFYLGVPLYDYRHEAGNVNGEDIETGAFGYIPSYDDAFGDARVKVGERFTHTVDILPFVKKAFDTAQKKGFLPGCQYENLYISGCNYGWEVPGTFDCMTTSYEFNMTYTLLDERKN